MNQRLYQIRNGQSVIYSMNCKGTASDLVMKESKDIIPFGHKVSYGKATMAVCKGKKPIKVSEFGTDITQKWKEEMNYRLNDVKMLLSTLSEILNINEERAWVGKGHYTLEIGKDKDEQFWLIITGGVDYLKNQIADDFGQRTVGGYLTGDDKDRYLNALRILDSVAGEYREALRDAVEVLNHNYDRRGTVITQHHSLRKTGDDAWIMRKRMAPAENHGWQIIHMSGKEPHYLIGKGKNNEDWAMSVPLEVGSLTLESLCETFRVINWIRITELIHI